MNEQENFKLLTIALAIGLLIGLERGWRSRDLDNGMRVAGLRTFGLITLLGGIWGILAQQLNPLLIGFAFLGLIGWAGVFNCRYPGFNQGYQNNTRTSPIR